MRVGPCSGFGNRCICCHVAGPKRSREELEQLLAGHRSALAASCKGYDNGAGWEAERLATTVFTLMHNGGGIVSLLTQLGVQDSLSYLSSGRINVTPKLVFASPALASMQPDGQGGHVFVPKLARSSADCKSVDFETWWKKEIIFFTGSNLTRSRLVYSFRHQDGGSHVGELTDGAYVLLKGGAGWTNLGTGLPPIGAATASMRQMAWEVIETLRQLDSPKDGDEEKN
jgi:hypothetical protein